MTNQEESTQKALRNWQGAPMHVKAMAAAYVVPILEAIRDISEAVSRIEKEQRKHETAA